MRKTKKQTTKQTNNPPINEHINVCQTREGGRETRVPLGGLESPEALEASSLEES